MYGWLALGTNWLTMAAVGRPKLLNPFEEQELLACMALARARGVVVGTETVILMAQKVASSMRPPDDPEEVLPKDRVTALKRRHSLSNLRPCTTGRPPSTAGDTLQEISRREELQKIPKNSRLFGGDSDEFTEDTTLAMDETPLQYCPRHLFGVRGQQLVCVRCQWGGEEAGNSYTCGIAVR